MSCPARSNNTGSKNKQMRLRFFSNVTTTRRGTDINSSPTENYTCKTRRSPCTIVTIKKKVKPLTSVKKLYRYKPIESSLTILPKVSENFETTRPNPTKIPPITQTAKKCVNSNVPENRLSDNNTLQYVSISIYTIIGIAIFCYSYLNI